MTRAVIFDVDGTLVTFNFDVVGSRAAMITELTRRGYDTSSLTTTTPTQQILDTANEQADSRRVKDDRQNLRTKLFSILDNFEMDSATVAVPLEGTILTLETLKRSLVRLGALTNSGRAGAKAVLRKAGLLSFFEFILTREDVSAMKPAPDGILRAVALLNLPREEVLYVGDSVYDIIAAKAAGVRIASVVTGSYSASRLVAESPDFLMNSIADLPKLL